ncbi:MAG: hypothetical protein ABI612_03310, partial [Betaproteobacteria bacterium]
MRSMSLRRAGIIVGALMLFQGQASADVVTLQNATATLSQTNAAGFTVSEAIDGVSDSPFGWAIAQDAAGLVTSPQTAVFESATDIGTGSGTTLTFNLYQLHNLYQGLGNGFHNLGRFRLSATTDARSEFADGLISGGDVTANWTVLTPTAASATNGLTLSVLGDSSLLASGPNPVTSVYTISAFTTLANITGFRLEAMEDPSLPQNGPGLRPENGNFVLTELTVDAQNQIPQQPVPEPS